MNQTMLIVGIVLFILGGCMTAFNIGPGGSAFLLYIPAIIILIISFIIH